MPFLVRPSTGTKRYSYVCSYYCLFSLFLTAFALSISNSSSIRALAFQSLYGGSARTITNANTNYCNAKANANANTNTNFVVPKRKAGGRAGFFSASNANPKMSTENSSSSSNGNGTPEEGNKAAASNPPGTALPRIDGSETVGSTRWLRLETLSYTDIEGKERKWDCATRTTKKSKSSTDAVVIIPILKRPYACDGTKMANDDNNDTIVDDIDDFTLDTLLVEQFRPPMGRSTLEFPAGLIDDDETPEQAALRELREETGYVGEACKLPPVVSRQVCMSPGLCDETVQCVVVIVDLDNPYNDPASDLFRATPDEGEHITVRRVSLKDGFRTLLDKGSSPMAIMGLYLFAMGLEIGKSMNNNNNNKGNSK